MEFRPISTERDGWWEPESGRPVKRLRGPGMSEDVPALDTGAAAPSPVACEEARKLAWVGELVRDYS